MEKIKIIFLDIDGVLNHRGNFGKGDIYPIDSLCASELNRICGMTNAKLVISSSWRIIKNDIDLKQKFKEKGINGEIIGKTPILGTIRGKEIQKFIDDYPNKIDEFIILDDDSDMGDLINHLIKTDFTNNGLTKEIANMVIERLGIN